MMEKRDGGFSATAVPAPVPVPAPAPAPAPVCVGVGSAGGAVGVISAGGAVGVIGFGSTTVAMGVLEGVGVGDFVLVLETGCGSEFTVFVLDGFGLLSAIGKSLLCRRYGK